MIKFMKKISFRPYEQLHVAFYNTIYTILTEICNVMMSLLYAEQIMQAVFHSLQHSV